MNDLYIGLDIGGTKCAFTIGNEDCNIMEKEVFSTSSCSGYQEVLDRYLTLIKKYKKKYCSGGCEFKAIGISVGGPLDSKRGVILSPPNLPGWDEVYIVDFFEKNTGIRTKVQNDANACAIAEWKFGAGKGYKNVIFLTFGTGIGAGLILDGRLYCGTNDLAGEVGHVRLTDDGPFGYGKYGSFEGYCSGGGISSAARIQKAKDDFWVVNDFSAKNIFKLAKEGDELALGIVEQCSRYLGRGIAMLIDILNPDVIILGSIFVRDEAIIRPYMEKEIEKEALALARRRCIIKKAELGEMLGDCAAISVAIYE